MSSSDQPMRVVTRNDYEYPAMYRETPRPPERLWVRGMRLNELPNMVAVVGCRTPTPYGEQMAQDLAADLAVAGLCIVSGLARGCDGAAHRGALRADGTTVAVLAGGLDTIHPRMHEGLAERVVSNGALVSEYPPGTPAIKAHFVERNRIIAWMSRAVVLVQGTHDDVSGVAAVVEALPVLDRQVLRRVGRSPQALETIVARSGAAPRLALAAVTRLEIAGLIARAQNGGWIRVK